MQHIIHFAANYPHRVLLLVLIITGLAAFQLPRLEVRIAAEALMAEDDPLRAVHDRVLQTFGSSNTVVVVIRDPVLFTPEKLSAVKTVVDSLKALPFTVETDSLFSIKHGELTEDEQLVFRPYLDPIPQTREAAEAVKANAIANPFVARNLLSLSGDTMGIRVRLEAQRDDSAEDRRIVAEIERMVAPLRNDVDSVFSLGLPQVRTALSDLIIADQVTILPLSLTVLMVVLLVAFGRWEGMLLPLVTAVLSIIWTLAFMTLLGIPLNVLTSVAPMLLVVIGSTEDIHLVAAYIAAVNRGEDRRPAIDAMATYVGLAVQLTFTTTYVGFLATTLNDITLLRDFGLVASTGLLFNFVITAFIVPAMLALAGARPGSAKARSEGDRYEEWARRIYNFVFRNKPAVSAVTALMVIVAVAGATRLQVNNNSLDFFPGDSPIVSQAHQLHEQLAGMQALDVVLSSGIEGTFERVRYLREIEKLQDFLDQSGWFDKTQSFADMVKEINRIVEDLPPGEHYLPYEDAVVRELLLFTDAEDRRPYVSDDLAQTRIDVRHHINSSRDLKHAIAQINDFVATNIDPGLTVTLTGDSVLTQRAGDELAVGQAKSLLLIVVAILLITSLLFLNIRAGHLAFVPNVLPIVILFGVMGFAGVPLNPGTAMVAAIGVGICVDDTMHFLVRYNREMTLQPCHQNRLAYATAVIAPAALRPCRSATPSQARRWLRSTPTMA